MHVLVFGSYDVHAHPRVRVLVEGLRAHDHTVVEANCPLGLDTAARVAILTRPWRLPLLAWRIIRCWSCLVRRARAVVRDQRPDAVLVGYLGHFDVWLARWLFPLTPIVLDHLVFAADTARDRGVRPSWKTRLLARLDQSALSRADVIVVDTPEHAAMVPVELADRAVVVPVGAPVSWFGGRADQDPRQPLRAVFFGLFTPLQGAPVVGHALAQLAGRDDLEITMIGSGQQLPEARRAAAANHHVRWRDWVPAEELPAVIADHDVCLGIFGTGPKTHRVVPNKVFQGAAAGCAIVTGDTVPQRAVLGDAARYVPVGDPTALAEALAHLAENRAELRALRHAATERAATDFMPGAVVRPLNDRLRAMYPTRPSPTTLTPHGVLMPAMPYLAPNAALRYDVVGRLAIRLHPLDVLEIGCGQGGFGSRLAAGRRYLAVEPDPDSYAVARSRIEPVGGTVLNADHTGVPTGSTYDLVCAFEVLEHLDNDKAALADWVELVRPGGHLLLSVPAWPHRFGSWDTMVGHYRRYTPDALADLMRDVGLVGPETFLYGWPLGQVLELVRNRIAGRRFSALAGSSYEERTAGSGRVLQPARLSGLLATGGTMPFRYLQRLAPRQGTGLVALARRPAAS